MKPWRTYASLVGLLAAVAQVGGCSGPDDSTAVESGAPKPTWAEAPCSERTAYVNVSRVLPYSSQPSGTRIQWNDCPTVGSADTPPGFAVSLQVGGTGFFRVTAEGFRTTLSPIVDSAAFVSIKAQMSLGVVKDLPGYDPTRAHALVSLPRQAVTRLPDSGLLDCPFGATTLSADGHPEGRVTYLDETGAILPGAHEASYAAITNLEPGPPLHLTFNARCPILDSSLLPLVADTVAFAYFGFRS